SWSALQQSAQPTVGTSIVWLSNHQMHDPCVTTDHNAGLTLSCGYPIDRLHEGSVVANWFSGGVPGTSSQLAAFLDTQPGRSVRVHGVPGKIAVGLAPSDDFAHLGGTQRVDAAFLVGQEWRYEMSACLRGPRSSKQVAEVLAMVRSTEFPPP